MDPTDERRGPLRGDNSKDRHRRALDPRTGEAQPAKVEAAKVPHWGFDEHVTATSKTLGRANGKADTCEQRLLGYRMSTGKRQWEREVVSCPHDASHAAQLLGTDARTLVAADGRGRPTAVDLDTGASRWTGASRALPIDAGSRWVLARASKEDGALSCWDARTGERAWQLAATGVSLRGSAVLDDVVALDLGGHGVVVLTASTGEEEFRLPDQELVGAGPGWLVATDGSAVAYYDLDS